METDRTKWLYADFNGLFGDQLCLSHHDICTDRAGNSIQLSAGMIVTADDDDADESGKPDAIFASGIVVQAPEPIKCRGSRWVLDIDVDGIRHESEIPDGK